MLKYLILGGGPTGLSIANRLLMNGEKSFLLLEKNSEAGGLCRSTTVDGAPFDIGGIHLLEYGNAFSRDFLFNFMPENEWIQNHWLGKIYIGEQYIDSPFESNIWELDINRQIRYLKDMANTGNVRGDEMPSDYKEWIYWKFGKGIADDYMLPYNSKMFAGVLEDLGVYWLYKLPVVSFEETLRSCLEQKSYGLLPGYGKKSFYYPKKYGYGEVWRRMAENLGDKILYNVSVNSLDFDTLCVNKEFKAETIITTIPWTELKSVYGMPEEIQKSIKELKHTAVRVDYHEGKLNTDAAWVYYPEADIPYHRAMVRHNFCPNSKGYGTETNIAYSQEINSKYSFVNEYTYPVNTKNKEKIIEELLNWAKTKSVIGIGRWGEWRHHNSDVVVKLGVELADKLCGTVEE